MQVADSRDAIVVFNCAFEDKARSTSGCFVKRYVLSQISSLRRQVILPFAVSFKKYLDGKIFSGIVFGSQSIRAGLMYQELPALPSEFARLIGDISHNFLL